MRAVWVLIGLLALWGGDLHAADDVRTVQMADGTRVTGVVVARDATFLKLADAAGRVHALLLEDIVLLDEVPLEDWEGMVQAAEAAAPGDRPAGTVDVARRALHRDLVRDGTALAIAPAVPMMATGIVFTVMGGFGDSPPFLGAGIALTANSFAASVSGARLARRFSEDPAKGKAAFETGIVLTVIGLALLDTGAVLAERGRDERNPDIAGPGWAMSIHGVGLVIAGHASIGSSAIQALEAAEFARGPAPPIPYASVTPDRAVFGLQGAW